MLQLVLGFGKEPLNPEAYNPSALDRGALPSRKVAATRAAGGARRQPLLGLVGILIRVSLCNVDTVSVCVTQLATASPNHRIS